MRGICSLVAVDLLLAAPEIPEVEKPAFEAAFKGLASLSVSVNWAIVILEVEKISVLYLRTRRWWRRRWWWRRAACS